MRSLWQHLTHWYHQPTRGRDGSVVTVVLSSVWRGPEMPMPVPSPGDFERREEIIQAAERIEMFRAEHGDHYTLTPLVHLVSGMLPVCNACGAYVSDLHAHREREQAVEALLTWGRLNKLGIYDGDKWVYADGQVR